MLAARRYACSRKAEQVEPDDLLAGLLDDEESQAVGLLSPFHVALKQQFPAIDHHLISDDDCASIPVSVSVRKIVSRAREHCLAFNRFELVGTKELLVGLLELWGETLPSLSQVDMDHHAILASFHEAREPKMIEVDPGLDLSAEYRVEADLARIVDANANRAREGLRVLEDYVRFALNDESLTQMLKECRHQLTEALKLLPFSWFYASRDTLGDVGTGLSTRSEQTRRDLLDVVRANCKRVQESLRTLEEYVKVESARSSSQLEKARYLAYSVEKQLLTVVAARERLHGVCLYWLVDPHECCASMDWMIAQAARGGVGMVQLRDKNSSDAEFIEQARRLRAWTAAENVLLIINDRPDVARLCGADGVHLGQDDLSVADARRLVGPDAILGVSTHSLEQAHQAVAGGATYIGVGPVFPSKTKEFDSLSGLEYVREVAAKITLPAFAIGGIDVGNVEQVVDAGLRRAAVSSALNHAAEPMPVARTLRGYLER